MPVELRRTTDPRLTTSRLPTPPPPVSTFFQGIGWVDAQTIGFRGFHNEDEVVRAALLAHRAMEERLTGGTVHTTAKNSATISRSGDAEFVVVGKRPIARLIRLGSMVEGATGSLAFELEVPVPMNTSTLRGLADHLYDVVQGTGENRNDDLLVNTHEGDSGIDHWMNTRMRGIGIMVVLILGVLAIAALPTLTSTQVVATLGTIAGVFAVAAMAGLVRMVVRPAQNTLS